MKSLALFMCRSRARISGMCFMGSPFLVECADPPWAASEDPCSGKMMSFPASASSPTRDCSARPHQEGRAAQSVPVLACKLSLKGQILGVKT